MSDDRSEDRGASVATKILGALLVAGVVAIVAAVIFYRGPDNALVLATQKDCLRSFGDTTCREIVATAYKLHAKSAPRFATSNLCEMSFGGGNCRSSDVDAGPLSFFVPTIAVVLATRDEAGHVSAIVPVYAGPAARGAADGATSLYYRGHAIGSFQSKKFGGADVSIVLDLAGQSLTGDAVRSFARN